MTTLALDQPLLVRLICLVYISQLGIIESSLLRASWDATVLVGKALYSLSEGSRFESVHPPHDVWRFIFLNPIFYMDYDIIGKLWT